MNVAAQEPDAMQRSGDAALWRASERWLAAFGAALEASDHDGLAKLFATDSHWRDVVALTWTIEHHSGRDAIAATLSDRAGSAKPRKFRLIRGRTPPRLAKRAGIDTLEALFEFETSVGQASGVVRLVRAPAMDDAWQAWMVATTLDDLSKVPGVPKWSRFDASDESRTFGQDNWADRRRKAQAFDDRDPACVVIGAGQSGLAISARLGALGVDTLVIDRHARIGDNWRKRYHALTLHNESFVNHFPFMPFPEQFPVYIPKDKLANWFEHYAEAMELNVWTGTSLVSGSYDEKQRQWSLTLKRSDGTERVVRPRHVVFATGVSAIPIKSKLPGLDDYRGTVLHSGDFTSGEAWRGKSAIVVGTGTSAHDVAQDLAMHGVHVTMIQRSDTYVVSLKEAQKVYAIYQDGTPFEDCDLISTAMSYPYMIKSYQLSTLDMKAADKAILDRLAAAGFRLNDGGNDGTGFQMQYMRRGGGYYFDVGCSALIADGKISLVQWRDVDRFVGDVLRMKDGSVKPAGLVVVATGYLNQQETVRAYLGNDVAERIGPVWGMDDGGELANMWKRTPQPGLWFTAGSLAQSRIYSKYLALQIKAVELGLIPAEAPPLPANGVLAKERAVEQGIKLA